MHLRSLTSVPFLTLLCCFAIVNKAMCKILNLKEKAKVGLKVVQLSQNLSTINVYI